MNPFNENPMDLMKSFENWEQIYPKPYNKDEVDPYTKTRIILMNGTEFEQNWFQRQFARHCDDNDLRRELALIRRIEQQQQRKIAVLKPANESILEHTISYEQLAVDLTAILAQREPDPYVKMTLDFALLEDFDHLYRYGDLLEMEQGARADKLVGKYTEVMPGRPTIAEHRFPMDNVRGHIDNRKADPITRLNVAIITAAEQQTMNYYMNVVNAQNSDIGRKLYQEIGLIEEQHVTQYECLMDPNPSWFEQLLCHEYTECYLYYSCYMEETDKEIKELWRQNFDLELAHLHKAVELLQKYEKKDWQQVIPKGDFPTLLNLRSNIAYVREILANTVRLTSEGEDYVEVDNLSKDSKFAWFQKEVDGRDDIVPSHCVIRSYIEKNGEDYRYQTEEHPIPELQIRTADNTTVGRPESIN
ncbi:hypothetical protein [Anaerolentibacter hominis]|uniref:hypothetical protein n=1 Tax=Anaerolentibacter hominis TaxID=3079009 RepID=UPI0031B87F48